MKNILSDMMKICENSDFVMSMLKWIAVVKAMEEKCQSYKYTSQKPFSR